VLHPKGAPGDPQPHGGTRAGTGGSPGPSGRSASAGFRKAFLERAGLGAGVFLVSSFAGGFVFQAKPQRGREPHGLLTGCSRGHVWLGRGFFMIILFKASSPRPGSVAPHCGLATRPRQPRTRVLPRAAAAIRQEMAAGVFFFSLPPSPSNTPARIKLTWIFLGRVLRRHNKPKALQKALPREQTWVFFFRCLASPAPHPPSRGAAGRPLPLAPPDLASSTRVPAFPWRHTALCNSLTAYFHTFPVPCCFSMASFSPPGWQRGWTLRRSGRNRGEPGPGSPLRPRHPLPTPGLAHPEPPLPKAACGAGQETRALQRLRPVAVMTASPGGKAALCPPLDAPTPPAIAAPSPGQPGPDPPFQHDDGAGGVSASQCSGTAQHGSSEGDLPLAGASTEPVLGEGPPPPPQPLPVVDGTDVVVGERHGVPGGEKDRDYRSRPHPCIPAASPHPCIPRASPHPHIPAASLHPRAPTSLHPHSMPASPHPHIPTSVHPRSIPASPHPGCGPLAQWQERGVRALAAGQGHLSALQSRKNSKCPSPAHAPGVSRCRNHVPQPSTPIPAASRLPSPPRGRALRHQGSAPAVRGPAPQPEPAWQRRRRAGRALRAMGSVERSAAEPASHGVTARSPLGSRGARPRGPRPAGSPPGPRSNHRRRPP